MSFPAAFAATASRLLLPAPAAVSREERARSWRQIPCTGDAPDETTHSFFEVLINGGFIQGTCARQLVRLDEVELPPEGGLSAISRLVRRVRAMSSSLC